MSIDRAIKWLLPSANRYFSHLESIAHCADSAADVFSTFRDAKCRDDFKRVHQSLRLKEAESEKLANTLFEELDKKNGTPIDRADLLALAHALDKILDSMDSVAEQIFLFKLPALTEPMRELVRIECEAVHEVAKCVVKFRDLSKSDQILSHVVHVNSLENEGDGVYHKGLGALFENMIDPIELVRQKEILNALESAIDACERVVNLIHSAVVKHG